jgi:NAD(P)-dependent dehydrogenase (short-subunit alcohol dehydrogenase family)
VSGEREERLKGRVAFITGAARGQGRAHAVSAAGAKVQPFMVHYTASKHAITGLARAFAAELGKHRIRVNGVHPGPVNTRMGAGEMVEAIGNAMETNTQLSNMLTPFPPNWVAEPDEIADAVCWLASDESRNVTAAQIRVDQGSTQY